MSQQDRLWGIIDTKWIMMASAVFLGLLGIAATFFPEEILAKYNIGVSWMTVLFMKVGGALYLGFAVLNWMARGNIIGGIYSRPVAFGNFMHFLLIAVTLLKGMVQGTTMPVVVTGAVVYTIFGVVFGFLVTSGGKACA